MDKYVKSQNQTKPKYHNRSISGYGYTFFFLIHSPWTPTPSPRSSYGVSSIYSPFSLLCYNNCQRLSSNPSKSWENSHCLRFEAKKFVRRTKKKRRTKSTKRKVSFLVLIIYMFDVLCICIHTVWLNFWKLLE